MPTTGRPARKAFAMKLAPEIELLPMTKRGGFILRCRGSDDFQKLEYRWETLEEPLLTEK